MIKISFLFVSAASIHTTRGFGGYRTSTCMPGSALRFLGPSVKIAVPLAVLWGTACSFLAALLIQSSRTIVYYEYEYNYKGYLTDSNDLIILAIAELSLATLTLFAVIILLRIDCKYDPDWCIPPSDTHNVGAGVSVIGGVGGFTIPSSTAGERTSRVAWVV